MTAHPRSLDHSAKLLMTVKIESAACQMEVDTGSSKSIISWSTMKKLLPDLQKSHLRPCPIHLRDYQGNYIPIIGHGQFLVEKDGFTGHLPLIVVDSSLPSLLGLDWFSSLVLGITGIHSTSMEDIDALYTEFADIFNNSLGKYVGSPI